LGTSGEMTGGHSVTRATLLPGVAEYFRTLSASGEQVEPEHREATRQLADWLAENREPGRAREVVFVCTGNSRRSMLGAMLGNAAAAFCELPEVRFFSSGTEPSAFNPRTIAALEAAGFAIEPTGDEAPRGESGLANPRYSVRWGSAEDQATVEFSKALGDDALPRSGFAAVLVCSEAAEGCPFVPGASARIPMPLVDPKEADGTAAEASRYAATRDEIGRILLAALAPLDPDRSGGLDSTPGVFPSPT
jgi:arsenate reductase